MTVLKFVASYYIVDCAIVVGAVLFTWWGRKRRLSAKASRPPDGFVKTGEIFIDPTTGVKQQVWFNPRTGQRHYEILKESRGK